MPTKNPAGKKNASKRADKSELTNTRTGKMISRDGNSESTLSKDVRRDEKGATSASDLTRRAWEKTYSNRSASRKVG